MNSEHASHKLNLLEIENEKQNWHITLLWTRLKIIKEQKTNTQIICIVTLWMQWNFWWKLEINKNSKLSKKCYCFSPNDFHFLPSFDPHVDYM